MKDEGGRIKVVRHIRVVPYDEAWPQMHKAEAELLREIFGDELVAVHHVGSTSVPGLQAKPIIDSMVVIRDIEKIHTFDPGMIDLGYRPRGECLDTFGTPGRFYFSKDTGEIRTHQTHVLQQDHFEVAQILNFRNYLRAYPDLAETYGRLKTRLAAENTSGIIEYILGKDAFVKATIAKANIWAAKMKHQETCKGRATCLPTD